MEILLVIVCLTIIFFVGCIIAGIVQYINTPKPPAGCTFEEYQIYYRYKQWEKKQQNGHRVMEYLEAGQKTEAIRELRSLTGSSSADAKEAVDQLEIALSRRRALHE